MQGRRAISHIKERAQNNLNNDGAGAKRQARMFKLFRARLTVFFE
jgi:hypothetical protein